MVLVIVLIIVLLMAIEKDHISSPDSNSLIL